MPDGPLIRRAGPRCSSTPVGRRQSGGRRDLAVTGYPAKVGVADSTCY
jgi:hypothetical protein